MPEDNSTPRTTRRRFLEIVASSTVLPLAAACSGTSGTAPDSVGTVAAGNISALPVGTLRAIQGVVACIGRDDQGVYAMTLTCTHQGCDIASGGTVSASGLVCGCHGSRFDANGAVTNGPAIEPLQHFAVSIDAQGILTVHGDMSVDASTRLKV